MTTETVTKAPTWRDRLGPALSERLASILVLLDTRYLPLLLLAAPQSYAVFQWLWENSDQSWSAWIVAGLGAAAFEFSYIGSVAWAENSETNDKQRKWIYATALSALGFSILVAIRVYWATEGWWAFLHAGFPLVNCIYTVTIHSASRRDLPPSVLAQWREGVDASLNTLARQVFDLSEVLKQHATVTGERTLTLAEKLAGLESVVTTNHRTALQRDQAFSNSIAGLTETVNELRASLATPALTHSCPTCGKGFTSASALGGHRSSCKPIPAHSNGHGGTS